MPGRLRRTDGIRCRGWLAPGQRLICQGHIVPGEIKGVKYLRNNKARREQKAGRRARAPSSSCWIRHEGEGTSRGPSSVGCRQCQGLWGQDPHALGNGQSLGNTLHLWLCVLCGGVFCDACSFGGNLCPRCAPESTESWERAGSACYECAPLSPALVTCLGTKERAGASPGTPGQGLQGVCR